MKSNLKFRFAAIVVVVLVCLYGIVGLPKSKQDIIDDWKKNIRLGLDLKGGSHLVLQIQLQDAFKAEADSVFGRLRDELRKATIEFAEMSRNDPPTIKDADIIQINITG